MKNMILIGCLIGSMLLVSGDLGSLDSISVVMQEASLEEQAKPIHSMGEISTASMSLSTASKEQLISVNDITLYDNTSSIVEKLGEPELISEDEYFPDFIIYEYPGMNVIFRDDVVSFVEILEGAQSLLINGRPLPATIEDITKMLGEPEHITEDGLVFERNEALLKLFIDPDTKQLNTINFFHISSM
ncbi:hypothetical protein [Paenibacillus sp. sgz302251]|uniref:hypothetical protein n=1 Tax=Paenibacillus sp. sgz302251 TaxID=3414493 RepID=UPI003C7C5082